MTSAGTLKDALSISSLLSVDAPQDHSLRYRDRQLQYLTPRNSGYTASSGAVISFDTSTLVNAWTDLSESFLAVPLVIKPAATMPTVGVNDWANLAFKSSVLSVFDRIVVRTASGQVLCDEQFTGAFADHLRLAFEKDQDWLKLVAPAIHYSRDRPLEGVVGLSDNNQIAIPSTSKYALTPAPGTSLIGNGNGYNVSYNIGHHERNMALMRATYSSIGGSSSTAFAGTAFPCTLNIPLSVMHDFFRQLSFPLTGVNLSFDFYVSAVGANSASGPMNPFVIGSSVYAVPGSQVQDVGGIVSVAVVASTELPTPRLYYHAVTLQPEASAIMSQRLAEGFTKTISWKRYEIKKSVNELLNQPSGTVSTYALSQSANAPRRVWMMAYPAGQINTNQHPSVLVTGANGFSSLQMIVNGKQLYNNPLMTLAEQYDELKQAMHLGAGGDPEALLPYDDFRLVSRIHCLDLTRLAGRLSDPNAPVSLQLQYSVLSQSNVDIVILLETEYTATISFTSGKVGITVGPATYQ